jgi:hypothetical protein
MVLRQFIQIAIFIVSHLYAVMVPVKDGELEAKEKFMIGGGSAGVSNVVAPSFWCRLMCVLQKWESLVISALLVLAMYVLRLINWGVRTLIACCRKRQAWQMTAPLGEG